MSTTTFARTVFVLGLLAAALPATGDARAGEVQLSSEYRYAAQAERTFALGGGTVSESRVLQRGLRLAAPSAKDEKEAPGTIVATAVYRFNVPLAAKSLAIEVGYRPDATAKDKEVAGLLFVRNRQMEERALEAAKEAKAKPPAEPAFFGNIYFLKGSETTTSVTLPAENHVVDGVVEVHLTAAAGQAFDAQYVQVSAYRSVGSYSQPYAPAAPAPQPVVVSPPSIDPFFVRMFNPYPHTCYYLPRPRPHHHEK